MSADEGIPCVYCGDVAETRDHITPFAIRVNSTRTGAGYGFHSDTVAACRDCNCVLLQGCPETSLEGRRAWVIAGLQKRLVMTGAPHENLSQYGPRLRDIIAKHNLDVRAQARRLRNAIETAAELGEEPPPVAPAKPVVVTEDDLSWWPGLDAALTAEGRAGALSGFLKLVRDGCPSEAVKMLANRYRRRAGLKGYGRKSTPPWICGEAASIGRGLSAARALRKVYCVETSTEARCGVSL